jgi:hypothetical protein
MKWSRTGDSGTGTNEQRGVTVEKALHQYEADNLDPDRK